VWFCICFGRKVESGANIVSEDGSDDGFDGMNLLHRMIA
jgi:hypothetical protein